MVAASGTQHTIRAGSYEAVIASIGASLRVLQHDGRDLVVPFDADIVRPNSRGVVLAPWPNRIVDGHYTFDGVDYEAPLTEPKRGHALHGLASWLDFEPVDKGASHVTLAATIVPQKAYPWRVHVQVTYELDADGLTVRVVADNASASEAPFGTGTHPYFVAGPSALDEWTLTLGADEVLEVTPDRLSPIDLAPVTVDADRFDFREAKVIGDRQIDHAYTSLARDDGVATMTLTDPTGTGVRLTWGEECPWVQVHTADLPGGAGTPGNRAGLAVEPMTCAPDAFNESRYPYDAGLLRIAPGESVSAELTITAV